MVGREEGVEAGDKGGEKRGEKGRRVEEGGRRGVVSALLSARLAWAHARCAQPLLAALGMYGSRTAGAVSTCCHCLESWDVRHARTVQCGVAVTRVGSRRTAADHPRTLTHARVCLVQGQYAEHTPGVRRCVDVSQDRRQAAYSARAHVCSCTLAKQAKAGPNFESLKPTHGAGSQTQELPTPSAGEPCVLLVVLAVPVVHVRPLVQAAAASTRWRVLCRT